MLLLDKIGEKERVLRYLIKLQADEFEKKVPTYFLKPNASREDFTEHLNQVKTPLDVISQVNSAILNTYTKEGLKITYASLYDVLGVLDLAAVAFNKVWDQRYEEAIISFSAIEALPLKKDSNALAKA